MFIVSVFSPPSFNVASVTRIPSSFSELTVIFAPVISVVPPVIYNLPVPFTSPSNKFSPPVMLNPFVKFNGPPANVASATVALFTVIPFSVSKIFTVPLLMFRLFNAT